MKSVLSDSDSRAITDKTEEVSGAVYRELPPTGLFCLLAVERQRYLVTSSPACQFTPDLDGSREWGELCQIKNAF